MVKPHKIGSRFPFMIPIGGFRRCGKLPKNKTTIWRKLRKFSVLTMQKDTCNFNVCFGMRLKFFFYQIFRKTTKIPSFIKQPIVLLFFVLLAWPTQKLNWNLFFFPNALLTHGVTMWFSSWKKIYVLCSPHHLSNFFSVFLLSCSSPCSVLTF